VFAKLLLLSVVLICFASPCGAQEKGQQEAEAQSNYNWKVATLGGTQYWTDISVVGGWRIQKNGYWGHFRLLDNENVRQAWGSLKACKVELAAHTKNGNVNSYKGNVVILLHGLCRSWKSMNPMAEHLKSNGYQVINFRYASSREEVAIHAMRLRGIVDSLPDAVTEINFVGHSLGNIVVRHYVADCNNSKSLDLDPRINRMVMLGPPNQGSRMARILKNSVAFKMVTGASGAQLSSGFHELESHLATPDFPFGIVAGNLGHEDAPWGNILLPGPDDFTVSKKETMLPGATDFLVRPLVHTTMMRQEEVLEATVRFLKSGYFISADKVNPIGAQPLQKAKQ
jgi:pimeloyl-ACP methyl ester carboxylesterase